MMPDALGFIGGGSLPDWGHVLVSWVLTYSLHSTLLLGTAWLLSQWRMFQGPAVQDVLWKAALLGGFLTASLHVSTAFQPLTGTWQLGSNGAMPPVAEHARSSDSVPIDVPASLAEGTVAFFHADGRVDWGEPLSAIPDAAVFPGEREGGTWWFYGLGLAWVIVLVVLNWRNRQTHHDLIHSLGDRRPVEDGFLKSYAVHLCADTKYASRIRLTFSNHIASPLVLPSGEICLPERVVTDLTAKQQKSMLAHEMAHVLRHDTWWRLVHLVVETVCFFQPLNRVASRKMREAAEFLCDDWAVQQTRSPRSLATCIHTVASWEPSPKAHRWAVGMSERYSPFLQRIHRLVHPQPAVPVRQTKWLWGVACLWLIGMAWGSPDIAYQDDGGAALQWYSDPNNSSAAPNEWPFRLEASPQAEP